MNASHGLRFRFRLFASVCLWFQLFKVSGSKYCLVTINAVNPEKALHVFSAGRSGYWVLLARGNTFCSLHDALPLCLKYSADLAFTRRDTYLLYNKKLKQKSCPLAHLKWIGVKTFMSSHSIQMLQTDLIGQISVNILTPFNSQKSRHITQTDKNNMKRVRRLNYNNKSSQENKLLWDHFNHKSLEVMQQWTSEERRLLIRDKHLVSHFKLFLSYITNTVGSEGISNLAIVTADVLILYIV